MSNDFLGPASISIGQGVAAFFTFMPTLSEVRKAEPGSDIAADVHHGEICAAVVTFGVAAVISAVTKSSVPLYVAGALTVLMVLIYEATLRKVA